MMITYLDRRITREFFYCPKIANAEYNLILLHHFIWRPVSFYWHFE